MSSKNKRALVVGAGMAGISAASKLTEEGWAVTILERRERIGGRIMSHTCNSESHSHSLQKMQKRATKSGGAFTCKACGFNNTGGVACSLADCSAPRPGVKVPKQAGAAAGAAAGPAVVDLGASWIHGTKGGKNPVCKLAAAVGAASVATRWTPVDGTSQLTTSEYLDGWDRVGAMRDARETALEQKSDAVQDQPLWDGLMALQKAAKGGVDLSTLSPREMEVLMYTWRTETEADYAAKIDGPDGLSYLHYDDDSEYGGDDEIIVNGYSQLFAAGKLDVSAMNIALAAHVTSIAYGASIKATASVRAGTGTGASASAAAAAAAMSGSSAGQGGSGAHGGGETASNVHVLTKDGREFFAELCIVTMPLPVLKKELAAGTSTLFDPPLPQRKQDAIGRMGASLLNKVMLRFDQAWWPKSDTFYHTSKAFPLFVNYFEHTGHPILVAFWSSTHAWESEALSDREIEKQCLAALNECLAIAPTGGSAMPAPVEVVITRWGSDPCSLGSYTHIPVGASGKDCTTLGMPVDDVLFFAGEATCPKYLGTVHGAYISGQRAAREILAIDKYCL